ncbi:alpha/beta hydrolase [Pseudoflavonifractor phocaeensis]|uniref:alpha/beta hydrolase n=1 Tax=Pseudoflavonifractor phocaeensis TaxID=1870988 RepID=UPI00210A7F2A|nr:alpha/beta hydrolase [Pseudoflavonifractor phocaeensis]MCQ4863055.1 alpha/beta hydrolase [Pseudoflavonifractor phocaeensis]
MSGYIVELSENVARTHVRYNNRYGIALAGDLYTAKGLDKTQKHPALVVGAPYGGVKEQGPCVYAGELARRGFVVLTFDPCYMGESGGEPRHVSSPDLFSENISAGVDFLGMQAFVDRERIGALGICGSGGFALSAAQVDTRIKAVCTASMYDMSAAARLGQTPEQIQAAKETLSKLRWVDAENGYPEWIPTFPEEPADTVPEGLNPVDDEFYRFYGVKRGHHPNARAGFTTTSTLAFLNYALLDHVAEISPRPVLLIVGDRAASRFFSEQVYERAAQPKELYVVEDAEHIDLYDRTDRIPFDKIEDFFRGALQ